MNVFHLHTNSHHPIHSLTLSHKVIRAHTHVLSSVMQHCQAHLLLLSLYSSFTDLSIVYFVTELIFYNSTVVVYSFHKNYYINVFTIFYPSDSASDGIEITVISLWVIVTTAIIIALLVVLLVKLRIKKQTNEVKENVNFEGKDQDITETFDIRFENWEWLIC